MNPFQRVNRYANLYEIYAKSNQVVVKVNSKSVQLTEIGSDTIEALLEEQAGAITEMKAFVSSYPKYGPSRRTIDFFEKKIEQLEKWKKQFDARNNKLRPYEAMSDQPYFVEETYSNTLVLYANHMKQLRADFNNILLNQSHTSHQSTSAQAAEQLDSEKEVSNQTVNDVRDAIDFTNSDSEDNEEVDEPNQNLGGDQAMNTLKLRKSEVKMLISTINRKCEQWSTGVAKAQLELLKTARADYRNISFSTRATSGSRAANESYQEMQIKFADAMGRISDVIHSGSNSSKVELPKIKLPEFHGKNTEWRTFIELFDKIVHSNKGISNAIKMQYLKTCLGGEAAKLVSHIAPTAENYETCYDILQKRYDNKRELLGKLFDAILNLPMHKSENSADLRKLHDTTNESILAIRNLGIDIASWDPFLNHVLLGKLHRDTIRHYECQLNNIKEVGSLKEFLTYIEARCLAIQSAESKTNIQNNEKYNPKEKMSNSMNSFSCIFCNEQHSISKCQKFLERDVKKMRRIY